MQWNLPNQVTNDYSPSYLQKGSAIKNANGDLVSNSLVHTKDYAARSIGSNHPFETYAWIVTYLMEHRSYEKEGMVFQFDSSQGYFFNDTFPFVLVILPLHGN